MNIMQSPNTGVGGKDHGGQHKGKIKVVGVDLICFYVEPKTLEPISCSCYDPYAWRDPEPGMLETIGVNEWQTRRNKLRQRGRP